eukprot:gene12360-12495_t
MAGHAHWAVASLAGVGLYNAAFKTVPLKKMLLGAMLLGVGLGSTQLLLVSGYNRVLGLSDELFVLGDSVSFMPILVLAARLCPEGVEATLFATLMSISNGGSFVGSALGAGLTGMLGIELLKEMTPTELQRLYGQTGALRGGSAPTFQVLVLSLRFKQQQQQQLVMMGQVGTQQPLVAITELGSSPDPQMSHPGPVIATRPPPRRSNRVKLLSSGGKSNIQAGAEAAGAPGNDFSGLLLLIETAEALSGDDAQEAAADADSHALHSKAAAANKTNSNTRESIRASSSRTLRSRTAAAEAAGGLKYLYVGQYNSLEEAIPARDLAVLAVHGVREHKGVLEVFLGTPPFKYLYVGRAANLSEAAALKGLAQLAVYGQATAVEQFGVDPSSYSADQVMSMAVKMARKPAAWEAMQKLGTAQLIPEDRLPAGAVLNVIADDMAQGQRLRGSSSEIPAAPQGDCLFKTVEEAVAARNTAIVLLYGWGAAAAAEHGIPQGSIGLQQLRSMARKLCHKPLVSNAVKAAGHEHLLQGPGQAVGAGGKRARDQHVWLKVQPHQHSIGSPQEQQQHDDDDEPAGVDSSDRDEGIREVKGRKVARLRQGGQQGHRKGQEQQVQQLVSDEGGVANSAAVAAG